ncbi:MAG: hypothetical protein C4532_14075 [Candidatus Abyssobacteria bacterium SURF_17]|uniref:SCP2 domain-containing protein n=1 Tax=Candidatus Abyssobacteria bacterium SURF_17 TaxID=2093361 RepID=A0A419EUF7_9BACT|nr:MAG: hypothetical protein C4532_14075 [Candidatus Abyssubacteria bacterium SURF_17]
MDASVQDVMTARLFFRAAFPVMKVPLNDDPKMKKLFENLTGKVQFCANNGAEKIGCYLTFDNGEFTVTEGFCEHPEITMQFSSVAKMNTMLTGGVALPKIRGFRNFRLLLNFFKLMMSLKLMMPTANPKDPQKRYLKVKMSLYMVTTALSVFNKLGDSRMKEWTSKQPDRIYQFTVEPYDGENGIAAYLRVKAGKTKAGRGVYKRRRPFVHFRFNTVDGAIKVLQKEVEFVEAVEKNCVSIDGSPEYASQLNDMMAVLQGMMT